MKGRAPSFLCDVTERLGASHVKVEGHKQGFMNMHAAVKGNSNKTAFVVGPNATEKNKQIQKELY